MNSIQSSAHERHRGNEDFSMIDECDNALNDLVSLDCVNIEQSIGFDYSQKFEQNNKLLMSNHDEEENPEIAIFCKELFNNCSRNNSCADKTDWKKQAHLYVLCSDVIAYFKEHIMNNKLMMESSDNDECIDVLKRLFCEHFDLIQDCSGEVVEDELLNEYRLDYDSMRRIIHTWIRKITLEHSIRNETSTYMNEFESLDISNADFKLLDVKLRSNTRSRSSNIYKPGLRFDNEEEFSSASLASSSKPSMNNSDDDNVIYSDNEFGQSYHCLEKRLNAMNLRNDELESEIFQLKQNIADLRVQSRNAEDLNGQLAIEVEQNSKLNAELKSRNQDLSNKLAISFDESEQFQKMIVHLKSNNEILMRENDYIKEDCKYYQNELKISENQIMELSSKNFEYDNILAELRQEKKMNIEHEKNNYTLEENYKEMKYQLFQKDQLVGQLRKEIKENECVIENLRDKALKLDQNLAKANIKLFRKNVYGSNKCLNKESTKRKELTGSTGNLALFNDNVNVNEDETVSNAFLFSEFNENTFHVSLTDNDFRYEQFEQGLKTNHGEKFTNEEEKLLEYFKGYFILADELKVKYNASRKTKKNDTNNNSNRNPIVLNESFQQVIETFLDYNCNKSASKKQEMLENLINRNKNLIENNHFLNDQLSASDRKLKSSKNQLFAVIIFIYKFFSLNFLPFKASDYNRFYSNKKKETTESICSSTFQKFNESTTNDSVLSNSKSISANNFESYTISRLSLDSSDESANKTSTNLEIDSFNRSSSCDNIYNEINMADSNHMGPLANLKCHVKISTGDTDCQYVKRMNSFSVLSSPSGEAFDNDVGNKKILDSQASSMNSTNNMNYTNEADNDASIDEEDSNKFKISFDSRNYINSTLLKGTPVLDDHPNSNSDHRFSHEYCKRCRQFKINETDLTHNLSTSLSMPNLLDLSENLKIEKSTIADRKDISTQTSEDLLINETELSKSDNAVISDESFSKIESHLRLKHQLTRDSGIDSDNTHQKQESKKSAKSSHEDQVCSENKNETNEKSNTIESYVKKTVASSKSTFKTPKPSFKYMKKQNESNVPSLTRNSNVDQDYALENSYRDAPEMNKEQISKPYTIDEDEYADDEYIEDRYIGEEYGSEKAKNENINSESPGNKHDDGNDPQDILNTENFRRNSLEIQKSKIESPNPTITSTTMSKLAKKIKKKKDQDLISACDLSIDEVLDLTEKPVPSATFATAVASFWSKGKLNKTENDQPDEKHIDKMRGIFKRSSTMAHSMSFEEVAMQSTRMFTEKRLKTLESNFTQIAMAYHTDEKILDTCISIYRDKFQKSNTHLNLLFEEIGQNLNKLASFLSKEQNDDIMFEKHSIQRRRTLESLQTGSIESSSSELDLQFEGYKVQKKTKKFLQKNLNDLNRDILQLKNMFCELITTSSLISGLKQESHLSDLVRISVSYVRELRKISNMNKKTSESPKSGKIHNLQKGSLSPNLYKIDDESKKEFFSRSLSMHGDSNLKTTPKKSQNWLKVMSNVKQLAAVQDINEETEMKNFGELDTDINDRNNNEVTLEKKLEEEANEGHMELGRSPLNSSVSNLAFQFAEELNEFEKNESVINDLSHLGDLGLSQNTETSCLENTVTRSTNNEHIQYSSLATKSFKTFKAFRDKSNLIADFLMKDSSIFLRKFVSMVLIAFSLIFVLTSLGSELGERCIDYIFKKIEVTNYYDSTRHT